MAYPKYSHAAKFVEDVRDRVTRLLFSTNRAGVSNLVKSMEGGGFFVDPASLKEHGACVGGLACHSLRVFELLMSFHCQFPWLDTVRDRGQKPYPIEYENIVFAALLHDLSKMGSAIRNADGLYKWNKKHPPGHGSLSIVFASSHVKLAPIERLMIAFHMGIYGTHELYKPRSWHDQTQAEYNLRSIRTGPEPTTKAEKEADKERRFCKSLRNCWYHNPICKWMAIADETATAEGKTGGIESGAAE